MKRIFSIALTLAVVLLISSGCSLFSSSTFNPPSWIIGTWTDATDMISYEFTSDNVVYTITGVSIDYKEIVEASEGEIEITESSSDTEYEFTYAATGVSCIYSFTFEDDTTIIYSINGSTYSELYKE